jgi:NAD(P)-dependent dehydrogenase (short-subunit alcohol dehydrogenase family)
MTNIEPLQKIALVTGANRGIGLETARQLHAKGIIVILGSRVLADGQAAANSIARDGSMRALKLDVASEPDRAAAASSIEAEFGRLDILINNAGVLLDGRQGNATSTTGMSILRDTFEVNFFGAVDLTQKLLPLLRRSEAGRIVNLSSILASLSLHATEGSPIYDSKTFAYDTSKTALNSFTIHLAHELRQTKIKVNSADPGWVKTEMGGKGAQLEISVGAQTSVQLATLPDDGPNGGYFHLGQPIAW